MVDEVLLDEHVRDGVDERGVGAGTQRNPLVGARCHRVAVARVDDDDLRAALLERLLKMVGGARAAGLRLAGVLAEHHDQLRIHDVGVGVGRARAVQVRQRCGNLRRAVAAVAAQAAAVQVDEARQERADVAGVHARRVVVPNGLGAVLVEDALIVLGDEVVCLVPRDLLELSLAALARALHGVAQAVGVVDPTADGAAAQAGANLVVAVRIVAGVVALHPGDFVVLHVQAQRAPTLAVHRAVAPHHLLVHRRGGGVAASRILGFRGAGEQRTASQGGGTEPGERRTLHERAARNGMLFRFRHDPSLFPRLFMRFVWTKHRAL